MHTAVLRAPISRRIADPVFKRDPQVTRHIFFVEARDVPIGLPLDPNPRDQNTNKHVYRDVRRSLLNEAGDDFTFHLKHKGITLVAADVRPGPADDEFEIVFGDGHGIVDGGHSYKLITEDHGETEIPAGQYVKFEVLTGVRPEWLVEIAGGLNTSVQVQDMSLAELEGKFDWIKSMLEREPYYKQIAWRENADGIFDARDIASFLYCFNIFQFSNDGNEHPVRAYASKAAVLQHYLDKREEQYERLAPIVPDILILHDTIRLEARKHYNDAGGSFGKLSFVESRTKGRWQFPFIGRTSEYRLTNGALLPMLAAFRWFVEENGDEVRWRGGFDAVLDRWESVAGDLVDSTRSQNVELGRNPNALGKSRNHWANLHNLVAKHDLQERQRD